MIAVVISLVAGRLLVTDPGLVRLRIALRVALASLLTGFASIAWNVAHHHPVTLAAPGILFAMIAPLFVRDARRPAWFATLLMLYVCASACFAAATALSHVPLAGDAGFLLVMFAGVLCQACGPRALGCAMLAVVSVYLGLYLHLSTAQLVQTLLLSAVAPAIVALVGRVLVPMRAAANVRLAIHTVTLRAARVLATPDTARLSELNEAALALEEQLALLNLPLEQADRLRERIVEVEVAAGQHVFAASVDPADRVDAGALRHAIGRLASLENRANLQRGIRNGKRSNASNNARSGTPRHRDHTALRTISQRLTRMRADLRGTLTWLPAVRATTAALLAMLVGHSLSPDHWFWAVITTFVVFLGTRSRADTVYRGAQRIAGTLAGALVSLLLATALHHEPLLLVAAMVLCVFGWAYYVLSAYAPGVFFITVLVGLVYGELGFAVRPLIELRIEEVMVGCLVSFAVAILLMPLAATRHVEARLAVVLGALREVVRLTGAAADHADASDGTGREPARVIAGSTAAAMRALDRGWHDLRIAMRPLQTQRVLVWNPSVELATGSLLSCLHWARVLSRPAHAGQRGEPGDAPASNASDVSAAHAASIINRLDALIARYCEGAATASTPTAPHADPADIAHPHPADAGTLAQLDGAVAQLFERLTQPAHGRLRLFNWAFRPRSA